MVTVEFDESGEPVEAVCENSRFLIADRVAFLTSTVEGELELLPLADVEAVRALSIVDSVECDEFYTRDEVF